MALNVVGTVKLNVSGVRHGIGVIIPPDENGLVYVVYRNGAVLMGLLDEEARGIEIEEEEFMERMKTREGLQALITFATNLQGE